MSFLTMRSVHFQHTILWIICLVIVLRNAGGRQAVSREYCQDEVFNATCSQDSVVRVTFAQFGRGEIGRCILRDLFLRCTKDVSRYLNSLCLGRRSCHVSIMDPALRSTQPCPVDVTWHLMATYECIPVLNQKWRGTCKENVASSSTGAVSVIDITDVTSGYVASFDTTHTAGTGSAACPWRIRAKSGQTIQLNAFSSIIAQTRPGDDGGLGGGGGASAAYDDVCYDVALIREHQATTRGGTSILPVAEQRITACSSDAQEDERTVFTSTSHVVDIVFTARNEPSRGPHFILGFTVLGCATPPAHRDMWMRREGEQLVVRCNISGESWRLDCVGGQWSGTIDNCSALPSDKSFTSHVEEEQLSFPSGLLITVAIGVGLGVFFGGTALLTMSWYMHSRQQNSEVLETLHEIPKPLINPTDDSCYTQRKCDLLVTSDHVTGDNVTVAVDPWSGWTQATSPSQHLHSSHACVQCSSLPLSTYFNRPSVPNYSSIGHYGMRNYQ